MRRKQIIGLLVLALLSLAVAAYATATGNLTLSGYVTGLADGSATVGPIRITSASAIYQRTTPALSSGANTISVPTGATCVIIIFPAANAQTVTLKGVTGDTGVALLATGTNVLQLTTGQTSFVITCGGSVTPTIIFF